MQEGPLLGISSLIYLKVLAIQLKQGVGNGIPKLAPNFLEHSFNLIGQYQTGLKMRLFIGFETVNKHRCKAVPYCWDQFQGIKETLNLVNR